MTASGRNDARLAGLAFHELTQGDAERALALAVDCAAEYGALQDSRFSQIAPVIAQELPRAVREAANEARLADGLHAFVIKGNRIDEDSLGSTPRHWLEADTDGSRPYAFLLLLYSALLGDAIGWATQQDGRVVTDVLPIAGMEASPVSAGSQSELTWHTEDAFSPYRADHVGLLCLRNPDLTPTTLAVADLERLPQGVVNVLCQPRFYVLPDASHTIEFSATPGSGKEVFDEVERTRLEPSPLPVIEGSPQCSVLRVDRDYTSAVPGDREAEVALRALFDLMDASIHELPLAPGDVCFIDNRNAVHGRRPFSPAYDGRDRWLKRVNTVRDLRRTRPGRAGETVRVIGGAR